MAAVLCQVSDAFPIGCSLTTTSLCCHLCLAFPMVFLQRCKEIPLLRVSVVYPDVAVTRICNDEEQGMYRVVACGFKDGEQEKVQHKSKFEQVGKNRNEYDCVSQSNQIKSNRSSHPEPQHSCVTRRFSDFMTLHFHPVDNPIARMVCFKGTRYFLTVVQWRWSSK